MSATPHNDDQSPEEEMSFLQHLEVLRWHLVRSAFAILLFATGAFIAKSFVFGTIIFGPKKDDFPTYKLLCKASAYLSEQFPSFISKDGLCIGQDLPELINYEMTGQFMTHILVSIVVGLIAAFPYILWELWRFVAPALQSTEKKHARAFVFSASLLFLLGVAFGYFIICPLSVNFFLNYQVDDVVLNSPKLSSYISLITSVLLACGAVFELPILVYFLTKLGLLTPTILKAYRRHALVGALVLSAVITPPDVFSQLLVSVPLLVLYEISIFISRFVLRKAAANQ